MKHFGIREAVGGKTGIRVILIPEKLADA